MNATEFLNYSGEHYNEVKKKWSTRFKKQGISFDEDIFQDTIIHIYNILEKREVEDTKIENYWYQSFLINTKRDNKYSRHKRDDDIDVYVYLDEFPVEDRGILLSDIEDKLKSLNDIEKHLIYIYYLTDITIKELEELTNIKDLRYKIRGIIKKIKKNS